MLRFRTWNSIAGWCCFAAALCTYVCTLEPTVSLWDCGEFITAAGRLEVGHPPGAPLFMFMARMFAMLAPDAGSVAWMVNMFSAVAAAFTVLFLFWSITRITRRVFRLSDAACAGCGTSEIVVLASGAVGSLACAFSDTFWFSAVEGEVYAVSSLFTAVVFWAILRWEEAAGQPFADRWLMLIACLMGLSIGVHLLNLLAIPAMTLVYYFRRYRPSWRGVIAAVLCSALILGGILYVIIPGTVKLAAYFELLFVNTFGLPFNTGVIVYAVLLVSAAVWGIRYTYVRRMRLLNTLLLSTALILAGYSSYSVTVIRSLAGTPMNEGSPDSVFALMEYLNREQYGARPLLYGPYYNTPEARGVETVSSHVRRNGRYEVVQQYVKPEYDRRYGTFFPRMYSSLPAHVEIYKAFGNIKERPETVQRGGEETALRMPSFMENLRFFVTYQLGHMYGRYFMWNFAGRQNDVQADGSILNGNWISGIPFMDSPRTGPQHILPEHIKNDASRNRYFMLPLMLGLAGLLWQMQRDVRYFWVIMTLFFMTGIAIVIYLNQTPLQPRERDYAYAGSFYAFAVWIGLGVAAIYDVLKRKISAKAAAAAACILSLSVPAIMAQQNCDDHDRSGRFTVRDTAFNRLSSCAPNAILFTVGDNDTFPLWYLQEVEGIRTDVRVVNMQLLCTDWYISQMKRAAYGSAPLPVNLPEEKYLRGKRDIIYAVNNRSDTIPLQQALQFIRSDDPHTKWIPETKPDLELDYITGRVFSLPVDRQTVLSNGTVKPDRIAQVPESLSFSIPSSALTKGEWIALEIISANRWERPVYWTACNHSGTLGLDSYLQLDGAAYRLVPLKTPAGDITNTGRIDSDILCDRLMNTFRWNGVNDPDVWLDTHHLNTLSMMQARHIYTRLAVQLLDEGKTERAREVLNRALHLFPAPKIPYDWFSLMQAGAMYHAGMTDAANTELLSCTQQLLSEIHYFYALSPNFFDSVKQRSELNVEMLRQIINISESYGQKHIGEHIRQNLEQARPHEGITGI